MLEWKALLHRHFHKLMSAPGPGMALHASLHMGGQLGSWDRRWQSRQAATLWAADVCWIEFDIHASLVVPWDIVELGKLFNPNWKPLSGFMRVWNKAWHGCKEKISITGDCYLKGIGGNDHLKITIKNDHSIVSLWLKHLIKWTPQNKPTNTVNLNALLSDTP